MRVLAVLAVLLLAGCGDAVPRAPATTLPRPSDAPWALPRPPSAVPSAPPVRPTRAAGKGSPAGGWEITVYYTAVERFHGGVLERVTGCPRLDCRAGDDDLGTYPAGFIRAVREEGTGLTTAGRYLNWSYDIGFWLDTVPRDSHGGALEPFVSAAADPDVLARGTRFAITGCGRQDDGSVSDPVVCTALRVADWRVTDEFTPGLGGSRHIDVYLGPETGPGFTESAWYLTLVGARLAVG